MSLLSLLPPPKHATSDVGDTFVTRTPPFADSVKKYLYYEGDKSACGHASEIAPGGDFFMRCG